MSIRLQNLVHARVQIIAKNYNHPNSSSSISWWNKGPKGRSPQPETPATRDPGERGARGGSIRIMRRNWVRTHLPNPGSNSICAPSFLKPCFHHTVSTEDTRTGQFSPFPNKLKIDFNSWLNGIDLWLPPAVQNCKQKMIRTTPTHSRFYMPSTSRNLSINKWFPPEQDSQAFYTQKKNVYPEGAVDPLMLPNFPNFRRLKRK